ncbi:hypothetical protein KKP3000_001604 [Alicyclobacillus fastidiosus]|uniref:Uncharacterized protein n=1 Tax=Alicyclobacillus fastidiosus TaxID=392011 RepID=A0ABV5AJG5_9BACL|nr:hypothetical protein [Alicyclobacillus fastidiosus]WEH08347.1 hypothetical protein PYS47_16825 [Alicyclobacillus fastidiosus]
MQAWRNEASKIKPIHARVERRKLARDQDHLRTKRADEVHTRPYAGYFK